MTATLSQSVAASITVSSYSGVATSGTYGSGAIGAISSGNSSSGAPTAKLVTTQNNSLVVGVGNDFDNAISRTPLAGQTIVHQDLATVGDTYWSQRTSSLTPTKGTTVTVGDSAPTSDRFNLAICEIVPAVSTLSVSASSINFGSVTVGTTATQTLTLTSTGTSAVTVSSDSISGTGFSIVSGALPATLNPGATLNLVLGYLPATATAATGTLTINSNSSTGATTTVSLSGTGTSAATGPKLTLSGSTVAFGSVTDGSSSTQSVTLSSTGSSPLQISSGVVSGTGFSLVAGSWPQTLAVGQSLTLQIKFAPTTAGTATGALTISSNSSTGATATISLTGTGTAAANPKLALSTTSLSFGSVTVGSSATLAVTLSSTGTSAVTVSSGTVAGTGFSLAGGTLPVTLNPGATTTLTLKFAPTAAGSDSGSLTLNSNSTLGSTSVVSLSGTGESATAHNVNLNWNPPSSSSDPVSGYHVYRGVSGGTTMTLLNSTIIAQTTFTDSSVSSATSYVYYVKSVDSRGVESTNSNEITMTIP